MEPSIIGAACGPSSIPNDSDRLEALLCWVRGDIDVDLEVIRTHVAWLINQQLANAKAEIARLKQAQHE